jgi:hypothetical protein
MNTDKNLRIPFGLTLQNIFKYTSAIFVTPLIYHLYLMVRYTQEL